MSVCLSVFHHIPYYILLLYPPAVTRVVVPCALLFWLRALVPWPYYQVQYRVVPPLPASHLAGYLTAVGEVMGRVPSPHQGLVANGRGPQVHLVFSPPRLALAMHPCATRAPRPGRWTYPFTCFGSSGYPPRPQDYLAALVLTLMKSALLRFKLRPARRNIA